MAPSKKKPTAAKKSPAKKADSKKTAAKKTPATKKVPAPKKTPAKKPVEKKAVAKKTSAPKKAPEKKAAPKKATAKKVLSKIPTGKVSLMRRAAGPSLVEQLASDPGTKLPPRLQALVDKSEISDLLTNIARGLDRLDETLLRGAFHPDANIDLGPGVFQGNASDYVHWTLGALGQTRESYHMITNVRPRVEGDVAFVESYCHAHFRLDKPTGREDVFIGSRYLDRMERRPAGAAGVWKIVHRKQIIDWARTEAVSDLFYHQNPDAIWSYRTNTDPSYMMAQFPGSDQATAPSFMTRRYDSKSIKF